MLINKLTNTMWKKLSQLKAGAIIAIENHGRLDWDEIVSIKPLGKQPVYDIEVEGKHNFVGNGIIAHNTIVAGNISPSADASYDLGDTTYSWRNLYLTGNLCFDDTDCMSSAVSNSGWTDGGAAVYLTTTADNVGIGTSSPLVKLHVVGDGTNTAAFMSGNVGIGNTAPGYALGVTGSINVTSGNAYYINGTSVLNATTLGTGVLTSSLTTVGALNAGSITSGFGAIDTGADNIITTGTMGVAANTVFTGLSQTLSGQFTSSYANAAALNLTGAGAGITFTNTGPNRIVTAASQHLALMPGGNVGIGTTGPQFLVHVVSGGGTPASALLSGTTGLVHSSDGVSILGTMSASNTANYRGVFKAIRARGTLGTPTAVAANDTIMSFLGAAFDGTALQIPVTIDMYVDDTVSSGVVPARISFVTGTNATDRTERLTIKNTGNVGIGTTAPTRKLEVIGGATTAGYFESSAYPAVEIKRTTTLTGASVGLPDAMASGFVLTTQTSGDMTDGFGGGFLFYLADATYNGTVGNAQARIYAQRDGSDSQGSLGFWVNTPFDTSSRPQMILRSSGNVGIGTTNPTQKLEVVGTVLATDFSCTDCLDFPDFEDTLDLDAATEINLGAYNFTIDLNSTGDFIIADGGVPTHIFNDSGNVGIGTTGPTAKLTINGTTEQIRLGYDASNYWSGTVGSTGGLTLAGTGTGGALTLTPTAGQNVNVSLSTTGDFAVNTNQLYVDTSAGNVGIGTTSPTNILSLGNAAARKFWIENSATDVVGRALTVAAGGTVAGTSVSDVVGGNLILQSGLGTGTGASTISFQTGTTLTTGTTLQTMSTKMTILGDGNVGIGDATPSYPLDVTGEVRSTSNIYANDKFISSRYGYAGTYSSTEVQGIWSIGDAYQIDTGVDDFGNLYGMGYAYSTNGGAPFVSQHQIVFTNNGVINAAIGLGGSGYFAGNVGIGRTGPGYKLDVSGDINFSGKLREDGVEIFSGMIAPFAGSCPTGWTEYTAARGRTVVGTPASGTNAGTVGTALTNLGTRTITDVPSHRHAISAGTSNLGGGTFNALGEVQTVTGTVYTGYTGSASVDVTMPYIQLTYCQKTAGADLAEWIQSNEQIEKTNIVSVDPNNTEKVVASTQEYDSKAIGIIATVPGWLIGTESQDGVQMALAGRVPTKITLKNGEIKPGDPITTSTIPGAGMKAAKAGSIVGKAMEAFNETSSTYNCQDPATGRTEKCGTILVFVNISWADPTINEAGASVADNNELFYDQVTFDDDFTDGDLASINISDERVAHVYKSTKSDKQSFVGVISTKIDGNGDLLRRERINNQIISEARLINSGRADAKVSPTSENIDYGDPVTVSENEGMLKKASGPGMIIGRSLEKWSPESGKQKIAVNVSPSFWYDPDVYLTDTGELKIINQENNYSVATADETIIDRIGAFAEVMVANLKAGSIETKNLIADQITLQGVSLKAYITSVVNEVLVSNNTTIISPVASIDQLTVGSKNTVRTEPTLIVHGDASISGTLTADKIESSTIDIMRQKIEDIAAKLNQQAAVPPDSSTIDVNTLNTLYELLNSQNEATDSAQSLDLASVQADFGFFKDYLAVLGQAVITDLTVTNTLSTASITSPTGSLNLLAGLMVLDQSGNVLVNGNLTVTGEVLAQKVTAPQGHFEELLSQKLVVDEAKIKNLTTEGLTIAAPTSEVFEDFTSEVSTASASITTNATAGKAILPAGSTELTINSPHITAETLIYVTPIGDSQNQVLYVKSKEACPSTDAQDSGCTRWFKVAINQPLPFDLEFNWWIIKLDNSNPI